MKGWLRGERGERGSTGEHGGEPGPEGARGPRGRTGSSIPIQTALMLGITLALVALIPSLIGLELLRREINQGEQDRRIARFTLCLELEKVKRANRVAAWRNYNRLDQTLALLGLVRTDAIAKRARADRDLVLRNNRQLGGYVTPGGKPVTMEASCVEYALFAIKTFPPPPASLNGG